MKQFLLLCDEDVISRLNSTFAPGIFKFLEVQGTKLDEKNLALTTPIVLPAESKPEGDA